MLRSRARAPGGHPVDGQSPATSDDGLPRWGQVRSGYRLPNPVVPFPGESLPGLIMRNAAKYHLQDPRLLLSRLSPPAAELHTLCRVEPDAPAGEALRELLGIEDHAWSSLAMGASASDLVRLGGHAVPRSLTRLDRRLACPQCLAEAAFHRTSWFIDAMPVCAEHRSRLVADCPRCASPLHWRGGGVQLCGNRNCNFDLRRAQAASVPQEELGGVGALVGLLGGDPPGSGYLPLPFGQALRLSVLFGQAPPSSSVAPSSTEPALPTRTAS